MNTLKLADLLCGIDVGGLKNAWLNKAAAELRRLHAENAELLLALRVLQQWSTTNWPEYGIPRGIVDLISAAIDRAEGGAA